MADELTRLIFEVSQKGAAKAERELASIEDTLKSAITRYQDFEKASSAALSDVSKGARNYTQVLLDMERQMAKASKQAVGLFSGTQMRRQEKKLRGLRREYEHLSETITAASESNDKELIASARKRMQTIESIIEKEIGSTGRLYQKHKQEFQDIVNAERKSLAELTQNALGGGLQALQAAKGGDIGGVVQTAAGGIRGGGKEALKAGAARGGMAAGAGSMSKLLVQFGKIAGPLALAVGAIGTIIKLFMDLDARVKEVNKSLLNNVPITELAASNYENFGTQMMDAEAAVEEFQKTVMTNADLRMLGLDPDEMGGVLQALNEQGKLLSKARREGVSYADALETAQVAALNLGVDAQTTAAFMGELSDVTAVSFDEAAASLVQIIEFAQEAGMSSKKFFGVVQNLVGEMGLYNYQVEETAALFSKLTQIMDAKNAEQFAQTLQSSVKNMSAVERTQMAIINGTGKVAEMADRTQERLAKAFDPAQMREAFAEIGAGDLFNMKDLEGSVKKLSGTQRDMLQSAITDLDSETGRQFQRYRNILEASRSDVMELQGIMGDFELGDQMALQIGRLEKVLGMPLERMNSVLTEQFNVNEDQLRMFKALKADLEGDLARLREAAETGDEAVFQEMAEKLGYSVKLGEIQNDELSAMELVSRATKKKQDEITKSTEEQKTTAEKQAEMQRTLLDTVRYKLLDLVSGIYETILEIYSAILKIPGIEDEGKAERARILRESAKKRSELRVLNRQRKEAMAIKDPETRKAELARIDERTATLEKELQQADIARHGLQMGATVEESGRMGRTGVKNVAELRRKSATGEEILEAGKLKGATYLYEGGRTEGFQGRESKDLGALKSIVTKKGEVIKGDKMTELLDEMVVMASARQEMEESLNEHMETNVLTAKDSKKLQEETKKILGEKGIEISDQALGKMAEKMVQEQIRSKIMQHLTQEQGYSPLAVQTALDAYSSGDTERLSQLEGAGHIPKQFAKSVSEYGLKQGFDAKLVTSGVPMLDLQKGDIIVDRESLAQAVTGGKGSFVPELMRQATRGGVGGGGGGGKTLNANFYINGNNVNEIKTTIMKVIEQWETDRSTR